jgi:3-oxoacyl-[acyl-carrier protein] reductase
MPALVLAPVVRRSYAVANHLRGTLMKISDQIVLVTGGSRGVGAAAVRAFAAEGARVIINWRNSGDRAEALAAEIGERAVAIQADVADRASVEAMISRAEHRFGAPVTTVVNNALDYSFNGDARSLLADIAWAEMESQFSTVVRGALNVIQAAAPGMMRTGFGRVINVGTNLFQNPVVPYHDYTAAKAALLSLTRTASVDLGPSGITVNMVSGGLLRTTDASAATPDAVFDLIAGMTPLRSVTTPEEFADALLFFASPWSRAVTGQNLVVDGGLVRD